MSPIQQKYESLLSSLNNGEFWLAMDQIQGLSNSIMEDTNDDFLWMDEAIDEDFTMCDFFIGAWFWLSDNHRGQNCATYSALSAIGRVVRVRQTTLEEEQQCAYDFMQASEDLI